MYIYIYICIAYNCYIYIYIYSNCMPPSANAAAPGTSPARPQRRRPAGGSPPT